MNGPKQESLAKYSSAELSTNGVLGSGSSGLTLKGTFQTANGKMPVAWQPSGALFLLFVFSVQGSLINL